MASKAAIAKNEKRKRLVEKYAEKRRELVEAGDYEGLQKLPRDSAPIRVRNRCMVTGRPRGYYRRYGMSRLALRQMALDGELPGVKKYSW